MNSELAPLDQSGFSDVPTVAVGSMWEVPEGSVVSGPTGTHKTTGGLFCLQETGTYINDTGDAITVVSDG